MANEVRLTMHSDERGALTVLEKEIPFQVKRVFSIFGVPSEIVRGGHGHYKTKMAMNCPTGRCDVLVVNQREEVLFQLDNPEKVLLLETGDWHQMSGFEEGTVLNVLASEGFDPDDYFTERPKHD